MERHEAPSKPSCSGHCDQCSPIEEGTPADSQRPLVGWTFGGAALAFFAVPVLAMAIGAAVGRGEPTHQLLGALAGLVIGTIGALGVARTFSRICTSEDQA
jgi:hypothetical protein